MATARRRGKLLTFQLLVKAVKSSLHAIADTVHSWLDRQLHIPATRTETSRDSAASRRFAVRAFRIRAERRDKCTPPPAKPTFSAPYKTRAIETPTSGPYSR